MKILLLSLVLNTAPIMPEIFIMDECKPTHDLAEIVMENRQFNNETLNEALDYDYIDTDTTNFIKRAYQSPLYESVDNKKIAVDNFAEHEFLICSKNKL